MFCATAAALVLALMAFNYVTDPFGAFGDRFFQWFSYDETNNPRVAKVSYLQQHHEEYDSYVIGCSSSSSLPTEALNELYDASFYNMIMYGADMADCEKIANYLLDNYQVENLVLNIEISDGASYNTESDPLTYGLHHLEDPDLPALTYYTRYLLANPRYGYAKLQSLETDTILPQSFDVFDEKTGTYDKRVRDVEPIGNLETYLAAYSDFTTLDQSGTVGLYQTENCMKSVAAIRDACAAKGVNFVVMTAPIYGAYFNKYQPGSVENFYTQLAQVTPYWDFSCSSLSWEPRYFYDATHFRNCVGEMMVARMAGDDSVWMPDDFGVYVTADNVSDHLAGSLTAQPMDAAENSAQVPILMYHHIVEEDDGSGSVTVDQFRAQMDALLDAGYTTVSLQELADYVNHGGDLPEKPVAITFDDGYASNYELAYPILRERNMKATIFVIGVSVGKDTYKDTDHAMTPHFSYEQAAEMVSSGLISVQSHTYDMHQWAPYESGGQVRENILPLAGESETDYVAALTEDFTTSRDLLEAATGEPVTALAFPTGLYTTLTSAVLRDLGVEVTLSTNPGVNTVVRGLPQSLCAMLRIGVNSETTVDALLASLQP